MFLLDGRFPQEKIKNAYFIKLLSPVAAISDPEARIRENGMYD